MVQHFQSYTRALRLGTARVLLLVSHALFLTVGSWVSFIISARSSPNKSTNVFCRSSRLSSFCRARFISALQRGFPFNNQKKSNVGISIPQHRRSDPSCSSDHGGNHPSPVPENLMSKWQSSPNLIYRVGQNFRSCIYMNEQN